MIRRALVVLLLSPLGSLASEDPILDHAPIDSRDVTSIQQGAKVFVNYCLGCHGAASMRYNRLMDLGLTETQIRDNLLFAGQKVGDPMKSAMNGKDAKEWFGVPPPDLSVIARSRSADWLYTYLRTFYRDPATASGWNNAVFPNVGMPHALWTLQGERRLEIETVKEGGHETHEYKWSQISEGRQSMTQYDTTVRDLVNYLVWMGEPAANARKKMGVVVLYFLGVLFVLAYAMKREFWKDVH